MGNRKQPFGYKMALGEIVIQESEAKLVQEIFLRYIAESLNELTESLRQQDVPYDEDGSGIKYGRPYSGGHALYRRKGDIPSS